MLASSELRFSPEITSRGKRIRITGPVRAALLRNPVRAACGFAAWPPVQGSVLEFFEQQNIFVLKNVEAAGESTITPKLFLLPLSTCLVEILYDDALQ